MDERAPRKPRRTMGWRGLLIVVGTCFTFLVLIVAYKALFRPLGPGMQPQTRCANHLRQFGGLFASESMEHGASAEGGVPLFFTYRRKGFIQRGREKVFICSKDPDASEPTTAADSQLYDTVDLMDPDALAPLCSYAVRDLARYPIAKDGTDPVTGEIAWLACDRQGKDGRTPHHPDGLNVLFADGAVQFKDRAFLGIPEGDPIVVGPDSPHPELAKLVFFATPRTEDAEPGSTPR